MSHCATDVTGHSFVNTKAGGPYRLHWQRHHLVENHMDAKAYDAQHTAPSRTASWTPRPCISGSRSARACRRRTSGADDAPAYDYFTGFPAYDTSDSAAGAKQRHDFFDLDSGRPARRPVRPHHRHDGGRVRRRRPEGAQLGPQPVLRPRRSGQPTGRPSRLALQNTFKLLYLYVKKTSTSGYAPRKPTAPPVFNDHTPPAPPGSSSGVDDDPSRGGDPSDDSWNLLDLFLAVLGFLAWLAELGVWLATLPAAVLADLATYPIRELLYEFAVEPLWSLYIAARKPLVMQGFLMPKTEEIMQSLVELGVSPDGPLAGLAAALNSPDGFATAPLPFDEKSGADPAYPRAVVTDPKNVAQQILGYLLPDPSCGQSEAPSEYLRPWKYPERDNRGNTVGWEGSLAASGPWTQGEDARVLMNHVPGDPATRTAYEKAGTPADTDQVSTAAAARRTPPGRSRRLRHLRRRRNSPPPTSRSPTSTWTPTGATATTAGTGTARATRPCPRSRATAGSTPRTTRSTLPARFPRRTAPTASSRGAGRSGCTRPP